MTPARPVVSGEVAGTPAGFTWCDVRWDGPGGVYDLGRGAEGHICAEHKPGHETHVCCCGAVRPEPRP